MQPDVRKLFEALETFCQGRPTNFKEDIFQIRSWLTEQKSKRPSGYMSHPKYFAAYASYHMPLHLPELFWILEQNAERLALSPPKTILDLGCGPGTLSLSALLWLSHHSKKAPSKIHLVDFSTRALEGAEALVNSIAPTSCKVEALKADLQDQHSLAPSLKADWIFIGHMLNEWGSGPRVREKKMDFINRIIDRHLNPGGYLFLLEPPLREPTLDLMWIRDVYAQSFEETPVKAPCPGGVEFCPMIKNKMGWCYAQPPREWATKLGLNPWDKEIKWLLDIRLTDPGFSYLVIRRPNDKAWTEPPTHGIAITNDDGNRKMLCTTTGAKVVRSVPHRGAYLYKG